MTITANAFVMLLLIAIDLSRDSFMKPAIIPVSKDAKSPEKGNLTSDSGVVTPDSTIKEKTYQPESNMDSSLL